MKKLVFSLLFFCFSSSFAALEYLPENHPVNGGIAIVPMDISSQPTVYYKNKRVAVLPSSQANQWLILVGIPLETAAGIEKLQIIKPQRTSLSFHVSKKTYPVQYLTITDTSKVDINPADEKRVNAETQELNRIFSRYSLFNPFQRSFIAPVHAPISSLFGLQRFYNKKPRSPHSGLDIAAAENTPVLAVNDGTVVSVKDYFFTGNTVIIDHGLGVFSLYGHLNSASVKLGQQVKQGMQVGLVGKTGRATGFHLHWSMIMNQTLVDPLLFVPSQTIVGIKKPAQPTKKEVKPHA